MKKLSALLLLVCLLPLCALAEMDEEGNVTVALDGAEVFFTPIEGSHVLTRESSASVFNRLGMSQRDVVRWMEQNDVYALLFNETLDVQIQIVAHPSAEMDFDEQSQFGLDMMCEAVENLYVTEGYDVESAEMCHTPNGHSYVRTSGTYTYEDGYVENMIEFFTCQSGYSVYVVMFTLEGAPTEEQVILCEGVVDSLWLSEVASDSDALSGYAELALGKITVRFQLPEGMKLLTKDSDEAAWYGLPKDLVSTRRKELARNVVQGAVISSDGLWEINWVLRYVDCGGDLDAVSEADADAFRQRNEDAYIAMGHDVLESSCVWFGASRYINVKYSYAEGGRLHRVNEYFTRQNDWNVHVCLVARGEPAPGEAHALLQDILESQRIIVDR